jgi:hypothetical protein
MKIRNGFISNSSSSSFIINKNSLSELQIQLIINYKDVCEDYGIKMLDRWEIEEKKDKIFFSTFIDNGYMRVFLKQLNIPFGAIEGIE